MESDGTETPTDVKLSEGETETSEKPTITQTELEEAKRQATSDALSDSGRLQKEAENAIKALTAANERTKARLKELEDAELKAAEGDSEQLNAVTEKRKRRQVETELDDATLKLNQRDDELSQLQKDGAEAKKTQTAQKIATRLGVDADRLIKLSKFTDGSAESMEELAKELPKREVRPRVESDSGGGGGSGGGRTFTRQEIADMPIDEYEKLRDDIKKAQAEGKVK